MQKYYLIACMYLQENTEKYKGDHKKLNKGQASI